MKKKKILLLNDTSLICHHGCSLLMNTMYDFFEQNNFLIKKKIFYEQNYLEHISNVKEYDLILINGEGTLHGKSNSDVKKVHEIFEFIRLVKRKYTIPIVIFNSTIAVLKKKQLKIIKMVDRIYVREKFSFNYLKNKNINSIILPDLLSLLTLPKFNNNSDNVIVTDSSVKKTTLKLLNYAKDKRYIYVPILYRNYLRYLRYVTFKVALKFNINFIIKFYLNLKKLYLNDSLVKFTKSNFVITGRFHGIFICLALMKPFYTFQSDTYKIHGILDLIGIKNRIIDINHINNLKLTSFSESEILKIKKFKIQTKKKFNKFVQQLHYLVS